MASTKSKPTLEKIAKAILPERPLYILRASKIPQEFRPVGTLALAGRHLDLTLQDYIPKWRGRRNLILLNDLEIGDYTHAMYHAGPRRIYKRRETLMVLAHELSHVAARPILESEKDDNLDPAFSKAVTASLVDFCKDTPSAAAAPCSWAGHGGDFIRTLFHTAHRVRQVADEWLPRTGWFDPKQYSLPSREDEYRAALGDEPERLADVPLTELSSIEPPASFAKLWRDGVQAWFNAIPNPSDSQASVWARGLTIFSQFLERN